MATKYARAGGGNWSADATWSTSSGGGADTTKPVAGDTVILDAASGNVTVDATSACAVLTCTGYTGTLALGSALLSTTGAITLVPGMTLTGSGNFWRIVGSCTFDAGGHTIPGTLEVFGTYTVTLASALAVTTLRTSDNATFAGAYDITCAAFNVYLTTVDKTITFVSGQTLTITTSMRIYPGLASLTIRGDTASAATYLAYTGADATTLKVVGVTFTDVDFSTYSTPVTNLDNWYGGTLTRTTGITNRTSADIGGGTGGVTGRCLQLGVGVC